MSKGRIIKKWRDLNTKEIKKKKSRRRHVACRKEGSFLLFKI